MKYSLNIYQPGLFSWATATFDLPYGDPAEGDAVAIQCADAVFNAAKVIHDPATALAWEMTQIEMTRPVASGDNQEGA